MKTVLAAAALAAFALAAGAASAQPRQGFGGGAGPGAGSSITLYDLPNFQGPGRTYTSGVDNLADLGLNDRAQSARVQGRWRVCQDSGLRGRCVEIGGDVANLATLQMTAAISSFEDLNRGQFNRDPRDQGRFNDPGFDRGQNDRGFGGGNGFNDRAFAGPVLDGRSASFFPRPTQGPYRNADEFCRRLGFSGVIYADARGSELRDVVCRR